MCFYEACNRSEITERAQRAYLKIARLRCPNFVLAKLGIQPTQINMLKPKRREIQIMLRDTRLSKKV
jgi:hypothetical protein